MLQLLLAANQLSTLLLYMCWRTASGEGIHRHTAEHADAASSRRGAHLEQ